MYRVTIIAFEEFKLIGGFVMDNLQLRSLSRLDNKLSFHEKYKYMYI